MIVFGVDPGTATTGYGVIEVKNNTALWRDSGVISTLQRDPLPAKLEHIYDQLCRKMEQHRPECVCVEQAFYAKNVHTTLILGHARGVALLAASKAGALIEEYSPREIKKSLVGMGGATKEQVAYMVRFLLKPPRQHDQTDAYDALAVALCGFTHAKFRALSSRAR